MSNPQNRNESGWHVEETTREDYQKASRGVEKTIYNTSGFNSLNEAKVDSVRYLLILKDHSLRFITVVGVRGHLSLSPPHLLT